MSDWDDFPGPTLRRLRIRRALKKWWEDVEKEHKEMKQYVLECGDGSGDGHNKREQIIISANMHPKEAYEKACAHFGFELIGEHCEEYEDNYIPKEIVKKIDVNLHSKYENKRDQENDFFRIYCDQWFEIVLTFCKNGCPEFEYEIVKPEVFGIGGYGLFF